MKNDKKLIFVLFIIAFIFGIISTFSSPLRIWDETVYANLGYDLSKNPLDYSFANNGWSDFIPGESIYGWPNAGFRAPLLPYALSILYFLKLNFLIILFIPFIGAFSVVLVYLLGKRLLNKRAGFYSAIFFMLLPLYILYSGKILTGIFFTFFVLLTFLSFWKGYEEGNNKYKILFGFFLALSLLTRYTALWIMPIFLIYFLIRDKSLKFLKDKHLWYAILTFFVVLIPWFIYGAFTYGNFLGAFIHGAKAASYWGGIQPWYFFFQHSWWIFSAVGLIFVFSLVYILYKKEFIKKEIYLLLIWIIFFLGMAMIMPHKEVRFILPILPAICLLSGFFIDKLKKYKKIILIGIIIILSFSLFPNFYINYKNSYTGTNLCFLEANKFLEDIDKDILIITDESSPVYYYTKKETHFYPNPWSIESIRNLIDNHYKGKDIYIFFTDYDMPLNDEKHIQIKEDLETNFEKTFNCHKNEGFSIIYKYS